MPFKLGDKSGGGTVVPDGIYKVRLDEWSKDKTRHQDDMLKIRWKIISGPYSGSAVWDQVVITEKGIFKGCQILAALGLSDDTEFENEKECANRVVKELEDDPVLTVVVSKKPHPSDPDRSVNNVNMYSPPGGESEEVEGEAEDVDIKF